MPATPSRASWPSSGSIVLRQQIARAPSAATSPVPAAALTALNQLPERAAHHRYVALGAGAGRRHPGADAGDARQVFRGAQGRCSARPNTARSRCWRSRRPNSRKPDRGHRRRRARPITSSTRPRYGTPESAHVRADRVSRTPRRPRPRRARSPRARRSRRSPKERGLKDSDIDLGTVTKTRRSSIRRSPTPRSRSRTARSARRSRAASAPCWSRSSKIEPGTQQAVRGGRRRDQARHRRANAREAQIGDLHDKIEDERAGGATLAETAQEAQAQAATHRGDRPRRPRPGRQAGRRPAAGRRRARRGLRSRRRRRERAAAAAGRRLSSGYDVSGITPSRDARSTRSRTQVEARWQRRRDREAAEGQGRPRCSTSSRPARRSPRSPPPKARRSKPRSTCSAASAGRHLPAARRSPRSSGRRRTRSAAPKATADRTVVFRVDEVTDPADRRRSPRALELKTLAAERATPRT